MNKKAPTLKENVVSLARSVYTFKVVLFCVILFFLLMSTVYAVMSVVKHSHFETFGDLGIFAQGIWQYSQFKFPFVTFHLSRYFLGDHFHPILIVLAPFFWLYPDEKVLLIVQPFIILSAIIPLYLIANKLTKSLFFSVSVIIAYSFYIPLQYTIFYDFHEIVFLPPLFAWAYYFFVHNKRLAVSVFLVLILLTKEELGFFVATFGFFLLIFKKGWRRFGAVWVLVGIAYSFIMINKIIPLIGGNYLYLNYGPMGKTPQDVFLNILKNPFSLFGIFLTPSTKVETIKETLRSFAFLSLLNPLGLLLSLEQFFTRFADGRNIIRWTIAYHYSAPMSVVGALGAILSVSAIASKIGKHKKIFLVVVAVVLLIITRLEQINRSAVLLVKRPEFWGRSLWMDSLDQSITMIPSTASVATQNNLISHVALRNKVFFLSQMDKVDYVLVDFHAGQSAYDFGGEQEWKKNESQVKTKIQNGKYKIVFSKDDVFLLNRLK